MSIPIRSLVVALEWVPKFVDCVLLLTDQEGVCCTTSTKRRVINPQLNSKREIVECDITLPYLTDCPDLDEAFM